MKITQVYSILNAAVTEARGGDSLKVKDLAGIISLGNVLLDSSQSDFKDNFLNALVDRIGKTIISNRAYIARDKSLVYDTFEFGAILQKIYVAPIAGEASAQWGLSNGQSLASFVIAKPTVEQDLYQNLDTWTVTVTIPEVQLKSAFTSAEGVAALISAIWQAVENSMNQQLETLTDLAYAGFIGERLVEANGTAGPTVVNLLADYNTDMGFTGDNASDALLASQALYSMDFLKYAARKIDQYTSWIERQTVLFNRKTNARVRHTPKDLQRLTVLDQFASAMKFYLQADTYHNDLVQMPGYSETQYWQAPGTDFSFANCSKINVKTPSTGYTVEQGGIVALLTDMEAIGVMMDNRRVKSQNLPNEEADTYFNKVDKGYFCDMSEQGVVFIIADSLNTPVAPVSPSVGNTRSTKK